MPMTNESTSLIDILSHGGWVMVPLLLCSCLAVGIILERLFWGLRRSRVMPQALVEEIRRLVTARKFEEVYGLSRGNNTPVARIIAVAMGKFGKSKEEIAEAVQLAGRREASLLQSYLGLLGSIASVSPLLGLLGTVFGMIRLFGVASVAGMGSGAQLSGGISEALIATATGLVVAIPSLVFYRYFIGKSKQLIFEMEHLAVEVIHDLDAAQQNILSPLSKKASS